MGRHQWDGTNGMASSPSSDPAIMAKCLDVNDQIYQLSFQLDDPTFCDELRNDLFMVVLTGAQSAGKSSVFRRITRFALPEASGTCTRIATLTQLRRSVEKEKLYTVSLISNTHDAVQQERAVKSKDAIAPVVKEFQDSLTTEGTNFIDDHYIKVFIQEPEAINISLVDLPGFHTDDDADSKTVNDLVQKYIKMDSTLVIHVCRGDQDYGSLLGNDFMRKQQNDIPRITVLTHCDTDVTTKERLQITHTKAMLANSSNVIAVDGRKTPNDKALKKWDTVDGLQVGVDALIITLQDKVNTLLPKMVEQQHQKLQQLLVVKAAELEKYQSLVPVDVAVKFNKALMKEFSRRELAIDTALRKLEQTMCGNIRSIPFTTIGCGTGLRRRIDDFDDLEIGDTIYYPKKDREKGDNFQNRATIKSVTKTNMVIHDCSDTDSDSEETVSRSTITSIDEILETIVAEIQTLNDGRGYLEETHTAPHPIIVKYAQAFATKYKTILETSRDEMIQETSERFDSIIDEALSDSVQYAPNVCTPMATYLKGKLTKIIADVLPTTTAIIDELFDNNHNPKQVNTANPHYLHDLYKKMMEQGKSLASDDSGAREIYHKIRAYLKVARKQVCEEATKRFRRAIALHVETAFEKTIDASMVDLTKCVKEPARRVVQRKQLTAHINAIKNVLALIESIDIS